MGSSGSWLGKSQCAPSDYRQKNVCTVIIPNSWECIQYYSYCIQYQAWVNWMNPSNLQYSVTLLYQTFIVTGLPPRMRRLPSGWKRWMVTRSWNGWFNFSTSMPQCLHDPWSGSGERSGVDCIVECRPFVPEVDSVLNPRRVGLIGDELKLPSNQKCMQEDRCRSCTICSFVGSLF